MAAPIAPDGGDDDDDDMLSGDDESSDEEEEGEKERGNKDTESDDDSADSSDGFDDTGLLKGRKKRAVGINKGKGKQTTKAKIKVKQASRKPDKKKGGFAKFAKDRHATKILPKLTSTKAIEIALDRRELKESLATITEMPPGPDRDTAIVKWKHDMHVLSFAVKDAHLANNPYVIRDKVSSLISNFLQVVAMCFIMMTKAALSVFSCYYPEGDDSGISYMVAQPAEPCWVEGGLQYALTMPAFLVILGYSFGYPISLATLYHKNKHIILRDQMLRAQGKGYTRRHNPDYDFRKRWGILYGYFLPSHYWWILVFIGRKFAVCTFAVGLRNYPTFQLAATLLVMFFCLMLQLRQRPLMCTHEQCHLLLDIARQKLAHSASMLSHMIAWQKKNHEDMNKESKEMKSLRIKIRRQEDTIKALHIELGNCESYLWNLNTVEECMSTGAVVLMLSGITFDTDFLKNNPNSRGVVALAMVVLLISMISYFAMAFRRECQKTHQQRKARAKKRWMRVRSWSKHHHSGNKAKNMMRVMPQGLEKVQDAYAEKKAEKAAEVSAELQKRAAEHPDRVVVMTAEEARELRQGIIKKKKKEQAKQKVPASLAQMTGKDDLLGDVGAGDLFSDEDDVDGYDDDIEIDLFAPDHNETIGLFSDNSSDGDGLFSSSDDDDKPRAIRKIQKPATGRKPGKTKNHSTLNFSSSDEEEPLGLARSKGSRSGVPPPPPPKSLPVPQIRQARQTPPQKHVLATNTPDSASDIDKALVAEETLVRAALQKQDNAFLKSLLHMLDPQKTGSLSKESLSMVLKRFKATNPGLLIKRMSDHDTNAPTQKQFLRWIAGKHLKKKKKKTNKNRTKTKTKTGVDKEYKRYKQGDEDGSTGNAATHSVSATVAHGSSKAGPAAMATA